MYIWHFIYIEFKNRKINLYCLVIYGLEAMQNKGKNNIVIVFTSSQVEIERSYDLEGHLKDFWGVGNVLFLDLSGTYIDTCFITNC